jgi:hypothetical protein
MLAAHPVKADGVTASRFDACGRDPGPGEGRSRQLAYRSITETVFDPVFVT